MCLCVYSLTNFRFSAIKNNKEIFLDYFSIMKNSGSQLTVYRTKGECDFHPKLIICTAICWKIVSKLTCTNLGIKKYILFVLS